MRANHLVIVLVLAAGFLSCAKKEKKTTNEFTSITQTVVSSTELPACSTDTLAQVFWVEESGQLVVCNGSSFIEIAGEKGDQGEQGEVGETGPAGSPANSGVWVFDKDSKPIGVLMGNNGLILFTNGAMARVDFATGNFNNPVAASVWGGMVDSSNNPAYCYYLEGDCSGTCYQLVKDDVASPLKGAVYRHGTSYFIATGTEASVSGISVNSRNLSGSCEVQGLPAYDGYAITKPYTFPDGITFPLKTPLTFGFKTEQ